MTAATQRLNVMFSYIYYIYFRISALHNMSLRYHNTAQHGLECFSGWVILDWSQPQLHVCFPCSRLMFSNWRSWRILLIKLSCMRAESMFRLLTLQQTWGILMLAFLHQQLEKAVRHVPTPPWESRSSMSEREISGVAESLLLHHHSFIVGCFLRQFWRTELPKSLYIKKKKNL